MDTSLFNPKAYQNFSSVNVRKLSLDAPDPPRYLIRVHSLQSQGAMTNDSFLSSAENFALQRGLEVPSLLEYSPSVFELHTHNHLTNYRGTFDDPFQSPFISLTVSLRTALAWAKMKTERRHKDVRIAVLDTTTIPASNCDCGDCSCKNKFHQNPVWPANMIYKACNGKTKDYPDEFVAFGHVRGSFRTCTFAELDTTFLSQYLPELSRIPRSQKYEDLPVALNTLWQHEQRLDPQQKGTIIHVAKQLSNDNLLIPMVAFVLCVRKRSLHDTHLLDTIAKAATQAEKQATYDFLGYFDAFPVFDFFSKKQGQQLMAADSIELLQTSALLERVKSYFAGVQEKEAHRMWNCTTVALVCRRFCPRRTGDSISKASLIKRKFLTSDINRAFSRLEDAVMRSKFGGLRLLTDALTEVTRRYSLNSGLMTPVSAGAENEHEFWTRTFADIANQVETFNESIPVNQVASMCKSSNVPDLTKDPRKAFRRARRPAAPPNAFNVEIGEATHLQASSQVASEDNATPASVSTNGPTQETVVGTG